MNRLEKFEALAEKIPYKAMFEKLSDAEIETCESFIVQRLRVDRNEYATAASRWMLDQEKPSNYAIMQELVALSN